MKKKITSFRQFSTLRRFCLRFGFDTRTTPPSPESVEELFLLSSRLGVEARDLDVPSGGTEAEFLEAAKHARPDCIAKLQHRVREELAHRRQALSVVVAIVATIAAFFAAKSSSQSAATARAAVNIILKR